MAKVIYLIGSLKNKEIPNIAQELRSRGSYEVFDDWWSASEDADDWWQQHEQLKGRPYQEAINGHHANCVFEFDLKHLDRSDIAVLALPAGKSGHLEFGYMIGKGKPGFILFDKEPERFDVMYRFANKVCFNIDELIAALENIPTKNDYTAQYSYRWYKSLCEQKTANNLK